VRRGRWLLRGLIVVALAAVIALGVFVQPLETPAPTPTPTLTPTATPTPSPTSTQMPIPTLTPTPTLTPSPTLTPTPACTETAGRLERRTYFSQTAGDEQPYRVYLLHGWPYDDAHWDGLGVADAADAGIAGGRLPPFIIVLPGGSERLYVNTSGGDRSFEGQVINDLVPHVDGTYRTWANREGRAIGGISRGGVWALEIAMMHPDLFGTVGGHSPALSVNLAPPPYDPFYLLGRPGVAALRIYLDAGDADWSRKSTQALHEAMDKQGIVHEFVVHPGRHENGLWAENVAEYLAFYTAGWRN
jgi:enterochelin esterase-like enzyme